MPLDPSEFEKELNTLGDKDEFIDNDNIKWELINSITNNGGYNYNKVEKVARRVPMVHSASLEPPDDPMGDFWEKLHSKYIGVIAAQSLGECNTQLILRTFHTSGVAVSKSDSMSQDDIVGDLSTASKCLHGNKNRNYKEI